MGAPSCRKMVARPKIRSSLAIMWICWRRMWIQPNHRDSAIKTWVSRLVKGQFWELAFLAILLGIVTIIIDIYIYIYVYTYMIPNFGGDTLRYNDTQLESNIVWSFCGSFVRLSTVVIWALYPRVATSSDRFFGLRRFSASNPSH